MRNAIKRLVLILSATALLACQQRQTNAVKNQDIAIEDNLAAGQLPPNAEIETLPPDESSDAPINEVAGDAVNSQSNGDASAAAAPH